MFFRKIRKYLNHNRNINNIHDEIMKLRHSQKELLELDVAIEQRLINTEDRLIHVEERMEHIEERFKIVDEDKIEDMRSRLIHRQNESIIRGRNI